MKNARGYTLVEAMISLGLLAVVLLAVYGVLRTGNTVYTNDMTMLHMQQQTRNAADRILREARQASSEAITTNYSGTNDKIMITVPTAAGIQYYLSGTDLLREYPSGTTRKIASNIGLLKFSVTGSLLTIQIRADKTVYNRTISFPLTQKVRLRNE